MLKLHIYINISISSTAT